MKNIEKEVRDGLKVISRYNEYENIRRHKKACRCGLLGHGLCGEVKIRLKRLSRVDHEDLSLLNWKIQRFF